MKYDEHSPIFGRSFNGNEKKRMGGGALVACFVTAITLCAVFRQLYLLPLPPQPVSESQSISSDLKIFKLSVEEDISQRQQRYLDDAKRWKPVVTNFTNSKSQAYELNGDIRLVTNSSTVFIVSSSTGNNGGSWITRPYARRGDGYIMQTIRAFKIMNIIDSNTMNGDPSPPPHCTRNFNVPAIVFTASGYAGNLFHDFSDILVPLYSTARRFKGRVVFLVTDTHAQWLSKYRLIISRLSKFNVLNISAAAANQVLCFPSLVVGLRADNKDLIVDPSMSSSTQDFINFLRTAYSLQKKKVAGCIYRKGDHRPRMLIISRNKTRRLINVDQVADLARGLGFDVVVKEIGKQVSSVAEVVNSMDLMVGVHGAGLTNMVFLPRNAVVIQIVPIGLVWQAKTYYQVPAGEMGLRYLEYRVRVQESSLVKKYPDEKLKVYRDPDWFRRREGWNVFKSMYLDGQDVRVDVGGGFRETLLKALHLFACVTSSSGSGSNNF